MSLPRSQLSHGRRPLLHHGLRLGTSSHRGGTFLEAVPSPGTAPWLCNWWLATPGGYARATAASGGRASSWRGRAFLDAVLGPVPYRPAWTPSVSTQEPLWLGPSDCAPHNHTVKALALRPPQFMIIWPPASQPNPPGTCSPPGGLTEGQSFEIGRGNHRIIKFY